MGAPNRVRELREAAQLSQLTLAELTGLSRQSIGAIESGRSLPAVDVALRLARVLATPVEALFAEPSEARISVEARELPERGRVALAQIAGRWVAQPLDGLSATRSADALLGQVSKKRVELELLRPREECRDNVLVLGCAPALGLLCDRLNARAVSGRFWWFSASSTLALAAFAAGRAHLAGVHLIDEKTGEPNLPDVRRALAGRRAEVITLARWEAGFVSRAGAARAVKRPAELARRGLRIARREKGSGARRLLDRLLASEGIAASRALASGVECSGQLGVADAVQSGAADVGIATRDAAIAFGLAFQPLLEERYDLVVSRDGREDTRLNRLFDALATASLRRELSSLGYDVNEAGRHVAEL